MRMWGSLLQICMFVDVDGAGAADAGVGGVLVAGVVYEQGGSHKRFGQIGDSW